MLEEDGHVMVLSTPEQQMLHMNLYNHEEHLMLDDTVARLEEAVDLIMANLVGVDVDWSLEEAIQSISLPSNDINWSTHPGPELRARGYRTKGDAWPHVVNEVVQRADDLRNDHRQPFLSASGGRAKLTTLDKYEQKMGQGEPVGRFIRMVDLRDVALCTTVKKALESQNDWSSFGTALGESYFHNGGRKYADFFGYISDPDRWGCGLDLKKCDAFFPQLLSNMIFDRLFGAFDDNQLPYHLREYIKEVHCHGQVVGSDRNVYSLDHGLCSGAPFTSLVESLGVQALTMVAISRHEGTDVSTVFRELKIKTLGDDQWFTYPRPIGRAHLGPLYLSLFGLEIGETPEGYGLEAYEFLGKKLDFHFRPYRESDTTFYQLRFPERPVDSASQSLARAVGHLVDNFNNDNVRYAVRQYIALLQSFYPGLTYTATDLRPYLREDGMYQLFQTEVSMNFTSVPSDAEISSLYFSSLTVNSIFSL
jgi:hypothetical protein